jgi:hypothetical protein
MMMRKSTVVLKIVIIALMFYVGCDDNDGGGGGGGQVAPTPTPPEGGGVQPTACDNCPCDFFSVPMTDGCWVSGHTGPEFDTAGEGPGARCTVRPAGFSSAGGLAAFGKIELGCETGELCCRIKLLGEDCFAPDVADQPLSEGEFSSCETCLEEYATALNDAVSGGVRGGPPYKCTRLQ